jgi:hypothetical protein
MSIQITTLAKLYLTAFYYYSEMRIAIEYQYTDRNYSRFVTYAGDNTRKQEMEFWQLPLFWNDIKPTSTANFLLNKLKFWLMQEITALMTASSAFNDSYSDNKILYQKLRINGVDYFEYTNDSQAAF